MSTDGERHLSRETRVVTKKEIVKRISEEIGLTQLKTKEIVQKTFDAIVDALVTEKRIELRNFGVFEVKKRAARTARNPRTNQHVEVPAKFVVTFKPGKEMEERVGRLSEQPESASVADREMAEPPSPSPTPNWSQSNPSPSPTLPENSDSNESSSPLNHDGGLA